MSKNTASARTGEKNKPSKHFHPKELAILKNIHIWREGLAQEQDMPREHILSTKAMLDLCHQPISSKSALASLTQLSEKIIRKEGDHLLKIIQHTEIDQHTSLRELMPIILNHEQRKILKKMRTFLSNFSQQQNIAVELLFSKNTLYKLSKHFSCLPHSEPEFVTGWRQEILIPKLMNFLRI